jgi:hypothetical protein
MTPSPKAIYEIPKQLHSRNTPSNVKTTFEQQTKIQKIPNEKIRHEAVFLAKN